MARTLLTFIAASALYGFSVGSAHCALYATRNLIKFPLLIISTSIVCALAYFIVARFFTSRLSFRKVQTLVIYCFRDLTVLLVSLSPVNYFIARILVHTDDSRVGEYSLFLGMNVIFVAVAGTLALVRQGKTILTLCKLTPKRITVILFCWIALTLFTGGQVAFYLRPFFGYPASRGVPPPFALGATPDARGARNFYEAVYQIFDNPPLPDGWGYRGPGQ